jgi:hypothetical protein
MMRGLTLLGFTEEQVKPQQVYVADCLGRGRKFNAVMKPRRSAKTTTVLGTLLGRCLEQPDTIVGFTTGINALKARARYKQDVAAPIFKYTHGDLEAYGIKALGYSTGMERITFTNGSMFLVGRPHEQFFRSEAFDVVFIDESGEASAETSESIVVGALPTFDTRPGAQIVYAGTAAEYRKGNLLWDALEGPQDRSSLLAYGVDQGTSIADVSDWEQVEPLLLAQHPGIGTLTTLDTVKDSFDHMPPERFAREYLGLFSYAGETGGLVDPARWAQGLVDSTGFPEPPERFGMAMVAMPNQSFASIVAAWRDDDGDAHFLLLDHRPGVRWLAGRATELSLRYRVPITHDSMGVILVHAQEAGRMYPRPQLNPLTFRGITTAAALITEVVNTGHAHHYGQDALTAAALTIQRRTIGSQGSWALGRLRPEDDSSPFEAAAMALRAYDDLPTRRVLEIVRPTG